MASIYVWYSNTNPIKVDGERFMFFIFSQKQKELIHEYEPDKFVTVFDGKNHVEYTEANASGESNWDDAVIIGEFADSSIIVH